MLTRRKSNAARANETIELRWHAGVFMPTRQPGIIDSIERRTAKRVFLDLLDAVTSEGRHVSERPHSGNYAPKLFAERPDRGGFRAPDFKLAMQALFAEKEIVIKTYKGPNRYEYECIERT